LAGVSFVAFLPTRQFASFLLEFPPFFFKNLPPFALKKREGQSIYHNQDQIGLDYDNHSQKRRFQKGFPLFEMTDFIG